jgi:Zn finger protein HypA/HybF involved in hydrogenase expression
MHEMSLAMGVLQIVEDAARAQSFQRVRLVQLEIGALAAVEAEAMRFCFDCGQPRDAGRRRHPGGNRGARPRFML